LTFIKKGVFDLKTENAPSNQVSTPEMRRVSCTLSGNSGKESKFYGEDDGCCNICTEAPIDIVFKPCGTTLFLFFVTFANIDQFSSLLYLRWLLFFKKPYFSER
jgi:hypothetical protein